MFPGFAYLVNCYETPFKSRFSILLIYDIAKHRITLVEQLSRTILSVQLSKLAEQINARKHKEVDL